MPGLRSSVRLFCGLVLLVVAGCTHRGSGTPAGGIAAANSTASGSDAPVVRIYNRAGLATVAVVAWSPDDPGVALIASLKRDGSLHRESHYVSIATNSGPLLGDPARSMINTRTRDYFETVVPVGKVLERSFPALPYRLCNDGPPCFEPGISARVPDDLLRANRDSLSIRFFRPVSEVVVTFHRDLIDSYLDSVDSVARLLRAP